MDLLLRSQDTGGTGIFAEVTPQRAGWQYLSMQARRLHAGMTYSGETGDCEYVHVILGGRCHVRTSRGDYESIGRRPDVFSGMPHAVYVPRHTHFTLEALTDGFEVATCWVPCDTDHPLQLVTPAQSAVELRGGGNASRQINSILPPGFDCQRLVAVEVYTPSGNWSSYPPHKHDRDDLPAESMLEETYYHRFSPPQGFGFQRVYSDDRSIDETMTIEDRDVVLVPRGYHPVGAAHGYDLYYLNVMAGPRRAWKFHNDPTHEWMLKT